MSGRIVEAGAQLIEIGAQPVQPSLVDPQLAGQGDKLVDHERVHRLRAGATATHGQPVNARTER